MLDWKLAGLTTLPLAGGAVSAVLLGPNVGAKNDWYQKLKLPAYNPPDWMFRPVWTVLYGTMGYASYRVLMAGEAQGLDVSRALTVYGAQLAMNLSWTHIFFGMKNIKLGAVWLSAVWAAAMWTVKEFSDVDALAGRLLLPYAAWVSFALFLNMRIIPMNEDNQALKDHKDE